MRNGRPPSSEDKPAVYWGSNPGVWCAVLLIRGYQIFLSPLFGRACRFYPTCSQYALCAFREWGVCRGAWLTLRRLLRCGPWCEGGYDPPPRRGGSAGDKDACRPPETTVRG